MKRCPKCSEEKQDTEFYVRKRGGLSSYCKPCHNTESGLAVMKTRRENPEKALATERRTRLKTKYGLTESDYDNLVIKQNGSCAICGDIKGKSTSARLHVDHNHVTGTVRGLLCSRCNRGLGYFRDNVVLLSKATEYLNASV